MNLAGVFMPFSIIAPLNPVNDVSCTLSVVHDANANNKMDCNGFIVLEKMTPRGYAIELFELIMSDNYQAQVQIIETQDVESFKKKMAGRNCYAYSFGIFFSQASNLKNNILNFQSSAMDIKINKSTSSFFLSQPDDQFTTSFEWARSQALEIMVSDQEIDDQIPEDIKNFIKRAKHIGDLSLKESKCLVM